MNTKQSQMADGAFPHKLEIEMLAGRTLSYYITSSIRSWLEEWITEGPFDTVPAADSFLCFATWPCRMVFVRIPDIKLVTVSREPEYNNPEIGSEPDLPCVIVRLRDHNDDLVLTDLDPQDNMIPINEVNLWQPFFFESGFFHFKQHNGRSRYVPVTNISSMETDRQFVCPQDPWVNIPGKEAL
jgi:hypothetical protein